MLNPFFQNGTAGEQSLIQSLVNEQIKMYGIEVYYMPRKYLTKFTVIKEVIQSEFDNAYPIEAYVDSYDGYAGEGTILSKFGIQEKDDLTLIVSRERFEDYITPLIKNLPNIELATRPKEGDLIYFPLGERLFEIKYVEHEQPFYQLQKNYVYQLRCELFRYEDEVIDTGVETIDDEIEQIGNITTLRLLAVGVGTQATANASMCTGGSVGKVILSNMGKGYVDPPRVAFSSAPAGGTTAVGIASLSFDYIGCDGKTGRVISINLTNAGCGYTEAPLITFHSSKGSGAAGTSILVPTTSVQSVSIANSGGGYITAPTVGISTPKHVGAAATATIEHPIGTGSSVIATTISAGIATYLFPHGTTGGVYYKQAPTVTFSNPSGSGNGATATAIFDETSIAGGTVRKVSIGNSGRFYTSAPIVTIDHPGTSAAAATIDNGGGIDGSSIDAGSVAFTTTGRAYSTRPTVTIGVGTGTATPSEVAVGIATIHPILGIVTSVSFNVSDPWAVGTGATIGAGYTVRPTISFTNPQPVRATATATVSIAGTVNTISVGNSGFGYISAPSVSITGPGGIGTQFTATGIATIRFDSIITSGTIGIGSTVITGINTTNMIIGDRVRLESGYHPQPTVEIIPRETFVTGIGLSELVMNNATTGIGTTTRNVEVGIQNCGIVTGINVTYGGGGYLSPPIITITNDTSEKNYIDEVAGVVRATGISSINSAGFVTSIVLSNAGAQYVLTPDIVIEAPSYLGVTTSSGSFVYNEIVTGGTSGATARVKEYDAVANTLEISIVSKEFISGESITGSESGAVGIISKVGTDVGSYDEVTPFADNDNIESEADAIIDFTTRNPFGMP
tara:strand:+ start:342 stop:2888 length:2547 start_codon:yes stop_codon:yes gene_type:complete